MPELLLDYITSFNMMRLCIYVYTIIICMKLLYYEDGFIKFIFLFSL